MKISITKRAQTKLDEIYIYYAELGYGIKGRKIRAAILKRTLSLKTSPEMGQVDEHLRKKGRIRRYLVEKNYKILYRIEGKKIYITDIFDTRQNPDKM